MRAQNRVQGITVAAVLAIVAIGSYLWGWDNGQRGEGPALLQAALAQPQQQLVSATAARERDAYFPNSEELAPDEMRVIACGTGMPTARESQAAACFLVELGNGDKFIFDSGTGSHVRIGSLEIPYDFLDKIFLSHLHTDHFGDFAAYYVGGWVGGRSVPLRVWGPSGSQPDMGTEYALTHWQQALNWDISGRSGRLPATGGVLEINEFDFRGENEVIFQENGVTITSFPAIHGLDGSVSFRLEWNGLSFVYGGDSYPNQWFVQYAQDADLVVHEVMMSVEDYITKFRFPPGLALEIGVGIHTSPESFGKIMSLVEPRLAVGFHFFNDFDTRESIGRGIRSTYDGPLSLADDYLVWNVTQDEIRVREAHVNPNVWPPPKAFQSPDIDQSAMLFVSPEISSRKLEDAFEVDQLIYDRINAAYGTDFQMRR